MEDSLIDHRALALVQPILERLGESRPPASRSVAALADAMEAPEWDVATALIYLESLRLIERQPQGYGQVAWLIARRRPFMRRPTAVRRPAGVTFPVACR